MDEIIESYIDEIGIVDCQLNVFNDFIINRVSNIIEEENILSYEYEPGKFYRVEFKDVYVDKPSHITEERIIRYITPNEARIRDLNYESNICVDLHISYIEDGVEKQSKIVHRHPIAKLPIMINSVCCNLYGLNNEKRIAKGECDADPGGYFIINGKERVIVAQERRNYNDVVVLEKNGDYWAEIRSMSNETGHSVLLKVGYIQDNFYFMIPNIDKKIPIPIGIIFKCFGLNNEDIEELFKDTEYVRHIIQNSYFIDTKDEALEHIAQFSMHNVHEQDAINYSTQIINYELLPHIFSYSKNYKILFLRNMIVKLMNTIDGKRAPDDRDNLAKKRIESTGVLLSDLFRTSYKNYIRRVQNDMKTDVINTISKHYNVMTKDIRLSFATGNWGSTRNSHPKNGVSQVLCRLSYSGMLSHLRRTNIQIGKEGKNSTIRQLHQSHAFFFCVCECFDPNTPILMWNGDIKLANDINVGDIFIGSDGKKSRVKSIVSGKTNMYEVKQKYGINYTVTPNHLLTLKIKTHGNIRIVINRPKKFGLNYFDKNGLKFVLKFFKTQQELDLFKSGIGDNIIDIKVEEYMKLPDNVKNKLYGFKSNGVEWERQKVELDPYLLGMWLGDGMSDGYGFSTADEELLDYWIEWGKSNDATIKHHERYKYGISSTINNSQSHIIVAANRTEKAPLKKLLEKYKLVKDKHIPTEYLINDRETRLQVLAGLVDTDGSIRSNEIRISQCLKNKKVIDDAVFLAQSLGFRCNVSNFKRKSPVSEFIGEYFELTITGEKLYEIPTILKRKKIYKHTTEYGRKRAEIVLETPIEVDVKGFGKFVGWQLEDDKRFLLGDFTVSHNSPEGAAVGIVKNLAMTVSITNKTNSLVVKDIITKTPGYSYINNCKLIDSFIFVNGELLDILHLI